MTTIYVDVLIVLNIYVNFFLLRATSGFTHVPMKKAGCIIASVVGSLFSLTILLPAGGFVFSLITKLVAAAVIVALAFGIRDKRLFLRLLVYFYIINFIFAGVTGFMYTTLKPAFMTVNNSYVYIDFSLISLVAFTALAYFAVMLVRRFIDRGADASKKYSITLKYRNIEMKCEALADTGNTLVDSFTGKPVIIFPYRKTPFGEDFFTEEPDKLYREYGCRMIPYSTIGNSGLIPVISPDETVIVDEETGSVFRTDVLIGITNKETPAIFNPKILA